MHAERTCSHPRGNPSHRARRSWSRRLQKGRLRIHVSPYDETPSCALAIPGALSESWSDARAYDGT